MVKGSVLIIDDEPSLRHMLTLALRQHGYQPDSAADAAEALGMVQTTRYHLVVCDIRLPDMSGIDLLEKIHEIDHHAIVIMISAYGSIDTAIEAVKKGAHDYLSKPFSPDELILRIRKAEEQERLREENIRLQREIEDRYSFHNIIGQSAGMQGLFERVRKVAPSKASVLLQGESGTGKELFARAIHYISPRRERPFVAVNCGAIPENLLESELFGHVKGSFTGALGHKRGLFEEAHGGTIFLDEIGELPQALQVKLLRVLQEEELRRVGDTKTIKTDARVIAATARNLKDLSAAGEFREELYYRLNVVTVTIPPLRERPEDIPLLTEHFLKKFAQQHGKPVRPAAPATLQALVRYPWPGNVRQLLNVLEQAVLFAEGANISPADLAEELSGGAPTPGPLSIETLSLRENRDRVEREVIRKALEQTAGNRARAALLLGISLRSLMYKIKEYALDRPDASEGS